MFCIFALCTFIYKVHTLYGRLSRVSSLEKRDTQSKPCYKVCHTTYRHIHMLRRMLETGMHAYT